MQTRVIVHFLSELKRMFKTDDDLNKVVYQNQAVPMISPKSSHKEDWQDLQDICMTIIFQYVMKDFQYLYFIFDFIIK